MIDISIFSNKFDLKLFHEYNEFLLQCAHIEVKIQFSATIWNFEQTSEVKEKIRYFVGKMILGTKNSDCDFRNSGQKWFLHF